MEKGDNNMFGSGTRRFHVGIVAAAASAAWVAQSLASLALPDPTAVLDITMIVPVLLTAACLWLLRERGAFGNGPLSRIVGVLCAVAAITAIPGQVAFALDSDGAGTIVAIVETAALIGALVLGGIAALRAHVLPRWMGIALILAQPLAIVLGIVFSPISPLVDHGDYTGALGHGIVWGLIAATLLGKRIPVLNEDPRPVLLSAKA
jgi:hypothetical protein